jgi:hypothetical protein
MALGLVGCRSKATSTPGSAPTVSVAISPAGPEAPSADATEARVPLPEATPSVASAAPADPCAAPQTILVAEQDGKNFRVVETRISGERVRTVLEQPGGVRPAIDLAGQRIFGVQGYTDLRSGETQPVQGAKELIAPEFVGFEPWVVSVLGSSPDTDMSKIHSRVVDFTTGHTVAKLTGYSPSSSPDGSVLFLRAAAPPDGGLAPYVDIMRWDGRATMRVKRIPLSEQGGPYSVREVVAISRDRFVYRIYDEHELRYYDQNGAPFFKGVGPIKHEVYGAEHKEQFDLALSADRRRAAFTEREWNELTYLVVVDLVAKKRKATRYYGSFPAIYGDYVAFASDPSFVRGGDVAFRQIKKYAIYAYHVPTGTLCEVAKYKGYAQPH